MPDMSKMPFVQFDGQKTPLYVFDDSEELAYQFAIELRAYRHVGSYPVIGIHAEQPEHQKVAKIEHWLEKVKSQAEWTDRA